MSTIQDLEKELCRLAEHNSSIHSEGYGYASIAVMAHAKRGEPTTVEWGWNDVPFEANIENPIAGIQERRKMRIAQLIEQREKIKSRLDEIDTRLRELEK